MELDIRWVQAVDGNKTLETDFSVKNFLKRSKTCILDVCLQWVDDHPKEAL
jgi:hypothetical protein